MGWEIKNQQFFCNTSDTFFGTYLDGSIWPDHDSWMPSDRDQLFHKMFNQYLDDNPQKNKGSDPRSMTPKYLEKLCGSFEENWNSLEGAAEVLVRFAKENECDAVQLLTQLQSQTDFGTKKKIKKTVKKKKKKTAVLKKKKYRRIKAVKKKVPISSWCRYELIDGKSSKFWEVKKLGLKYSVRYGRIGESGQSMVKLMKTSEQAYEEVEKMKKSKIKKGYMKVKDENKTVVR
jgi:predicted DNA-binding WGR domain protein